MDEAIRSDAEQNFAAALATWRLRGGSYPSDLINAATDLLVAGFDSPSLRMLAGVSRNESRSVIQSLLEDTLAELDLAWLLVISPERVLLESMLRHYLSGALGLRELAAWAHRNIGHDGDAGCQPFVTLYDIHLDWEYSGRDLQELDEAARREAVAFLSGAPLTGFQELWPPVAGSPASPRQPAGWWTRLRQATRPR